MVIANNHPSSTRDGAPKTGSCRLLLDCGTEEDNLGLKPPTESTNAREGSRKMEPIDHLPGHEIERLKEEIKEQYGDAE